MQIYIFAVFNYIITASVIIGTLKVVFTCSIKKLLEIPILLKKTKNILNEQKRSVNRTFKLSPDESLI